MFGLNKSQDIIRNEEDTEQDSPGKAKLQSRSLRRRLPHADQRKQSLAQHAEKIRRSPFVGKKKPRKNAESDTPSSPNSPINTSSPTSESLDLKNRETSAENQTKNINYRKLDFSNNTSGNSTDFPDKNGSQCSKYTNFDFSNKDTKNSENPSKEKSTKTLNYVKLRWEKKDGKNNVSLVNNQSANTTPFKQPINGDRRESNASVFYSNLSTAKSPYINTYSGSDSSTRFKY